MYVSSESKTVQGKKEEIYKRYGREWNIRPQGGGYGNWFLTKKSDVLVDGVSYRNKVLNTYCAYKLTPQLVEKFIKDVDNGKIICFCVDYEHSS